MANPSEIGDLITNITDDVKMIIADEIALAKAELKPTVTKAGVGSGMFAVALYFIISVSTLLWIFGSIGFSWLYASVTSWSGWACGFVGTATMIVLLLILAAIVAIIGKNFFQKITGPEKTPETVHQAISALKTGVAQGKDRVAAEVESVPAVVEQH
ncbi:MAG: phage holin family protein [Propionibacteriaceae bacterium]|nr:phage holin family protein [Propionibacteriaceae bacterium]